MVSSATAKSVSVVRVEITRTAAPLDTPNGGGHWDELLTSTLQPGAAATGYG